MRDKAGITVVESIVRKILTEKESITSLELKEELRNIGFEANQKDVSEQLQYCHDIMGLEFEYVQIDGKSFKKYFHGTSDVEIEDEDVVYSYTEDGDLIWWFLYIQEKSLPML